MKKEKIFSLLCLLIVIGIILLTFLFRDSIEKYSEIGYFGVLIACMASTATILLPAPGIIVVLQYAYDLNDFYVILIGALGTALGEITGYLIGYSGSKLINCRTDNYFFNKIKEKPYFAVFLFSVIPLPLFDLIGVCSGIIRLNYFKFFCVCFIGKFIKLWLYVCFFNYINNVLEITY